jgi:dTMP kinase
MTDRRGIFITFEGIDGSGKSTQLDRTRSLFTAAGRETIATREPGGTPLGNRIRELLLHTSEDEPSPEAELALMFAARAQHIARVILPALNRGAVVLSDRFTDASEAYQGAGRALGRDAIVALENALCRGLKPHLTLVLDMEIRAALARARHRLQQRASAEGRFERENTEFFERVRAAYLAIAQREPQRCVVVDASGDEVAVARRVAEVLRGRGWLPGPVQEFR